MYAVVEASGHQFKVEEGTTLRLDKIPGDVGAQIAFHRVVMLRNADDVHVGTPYVEGTSIVGTIVSHGKGPKVHAIKFKRRKGYHRKIGFRAQYTDVRIDKIEG